MDKLDLFGSQILLRFNGQPTHNTKFGSIFTISILAIIGLRLFFIIKDVFQRSSPQVIFQERQVDNPSIFSITNQSFQVAFGMQDSGFNHYIDDSIYSIQVTQRRKYKVYSNGVYEDVWEDREIPLKRCSLDNFPDLTTRPKFEVLAYQNLFCFPANEELFVEGDFNSPSHRFLRVKVTKCEPTPERECKSPDIIHKYLKSAIFSVYFSDTYVDPTRKNDPFQKLARDVFFTTSTEVPKDVDFYFRNSYVESDFGWVTEDIQTIHTALFSRTEVGIQPPDFKDYYVQLILRFEKQKENLYQRKYKNLNSIISEIGGFTQSLLAIGFLICSRYSQLDLNKNIINEAFNFKNISSSTPFQSNEILSPRDSADLSSTKRDQQLILKQQEPNCDNPHLLSIFPCPSPQSFVQLNKQDKIFQSQLNGFSSGRGDPSAEQKNLINLLNDTQQNSFHNRQSVIAKDQSQNQIEINKNIILKPIPYQQDNQSKLKRQLNLNYIEGSSQNNEKQMLSKMIQNQNETIKQNINVLDNIGFFSPDHEKVKKQQQKLEEKEQKIKESLFKKLIQKATSHMSLGVFEYLKLIVWPFGKLKQKKKVLDFGIDTLYQHLDVLYVIKKLLEVDKLKRILLDEDQIKLFEYIPKPTIYSNYGYTQQGEQLKIKIDNHHQDKHTELQKAQQAYQAYKNIFQKQKVTLLDSKLVDLVDPQLLSLFGHPDTLQENFMQSLYYQNKNFQNISNQQIDSIAQIQKMDMSNPPYYQAEYQKNGQNQIQLSNSNLQNQPNSLSPKYPQPLSSQIKSQNSPQKQITNQKEAKQLNHQDMNISMNQLSKYKVNQSHQHNQSQQKQQVNKINESPHISVSQTIPTSVMDNIIPPYSPDIKSQTKMSISSENANDQEQEDSPTMQVNNFIVNPHKKLSSENIESYSIDQNYIENNNSS